MAVTFQMKLAGQTVGVSALYESTKVFCREYLVGEGDEADVEGERPGTADTGAEPQKEQSGEGSFSIEISEADIAYEKQKSAEEERVAGLPERAFRDEYLETLAVYRKISDRSPAFDTFLFHGSCIAVDGEGYLFTAPSGTGKSTHTRLWRELFGERAVMVNDDKPLLKVVGGGECSSAEQPVESTTPTVYVYGTPWDGKHRLSTNICVPLKGLCVLERGEANSIERVSKQEVYAQLLQQVYRPSEPEMLVKTMQLVDALCEAVPLYRLCCNMDLEAARIAYNGMQDE